jgi:hypothetical protein
MMDLFPPRLIVHTKVVEKSGFSREEFKEIRRRYPRSYFAFGAQRALAHRRGIGWELTFSEWWNLWKLSGKWRERGNKSGQFCMGRYYDIGPYSVDNVYICTVNQNARDANRWRRGEL